MPYVMVHHKSEDYEKWKAAFDEHGAMRKQYGSKGGYLFRSVDDPNEQVIVIEFDDLDRAREFVASEDLRAAMQRAGVSGPPTIVFMELADRPSA